MSSPKGDNWFKQVFGFDENVLDVQEYIREEKRQDGVYLISKAFTPERAFNSGFFHIKSISDFNLKPRGGGTFNIVSGKRGRYPSLCSVTQAHSMPQNNGATFQAASNFNCLEFVSKHQKASAGIVDYPADHTQGPYCAISTPASILYRNYFVEVDGDKGQLKNEINLLSKTPFEIAHGYPNIKEVKELKNYKTFNWADQNNYQMGVHTNCHVLINQDAKGHLFLVDNKQIAHHVYCAALDFGGSVPLNDLFLDIGFQILRASYKITVLAAWENSLKYPGLQGSKKLYLTLLGGGVFNNPRPSIVSAIVEQEQLIVDSGLQVYCIFFAGFDQKNPDDFPLLELMHRTNGEFIQE